MPVVNFNLIGFWTFETIIPLSLKKVVSSSGQLFHQNISYIFRRLGAMSSGPDIWSPFPYLSISVSLPLKTQKWLDEWSYQVSLTCNVIMGFYCHHSQQVDRWSDDHYEREKRQADWDFHKDSFFCAVPSECALPSLCFLLAMIMRAQKHVYRLVSPGLCYLSVKIYKSVIMESSFVYGT